MRRSNKIYPSPPKVVAVKGPGLGSPAEMKTMVNQSVKGIRPGATPSQIRKTQYTPMTTTSTPSPTSTPYPNGPVKSLATSHYTNSFLGEGSTPLKSQQVYDQSKLMYNPTSLPSPSTDTASSGGSITPRSQ